MIRNKNLKNLKKLIGISKLKFICDRYTIPKKKLHIISFRVNLFLN